MLKIKAEPYRIWELADVMKWLPTAVMLPLQEFCYLKLLDMLANLNLISERIKNK